MLNYVYMYLIMYFKKEKTKDFKEIDLKKTTKGVRCK